MRRGTLMILLAGLMLAAACSDTTSKRVAPSQQASRLPERTGEPAAYDLLDGLLNTLVTAPMPPGYTAPAQLDGLTAAKFNPKAFNRDSKMLGGVVIWPTGPNALDQITFTVAATADAAATSFALPGGAMGPPAESFTPSEFSVPVRCTVAAAAPGSGATTSCSALVGTVIVAVVTRRHPGLSRDSTADAVALLRVGIAHLQAVQAEQARLATVVSTTRVVRIGLLTSYWSREYRGLFVKRMSDLGWAQGRNLVMEYRFFEDQPERLPELVADLVRARVDVIVADDVNATRAAQAATTTIPVIFLLFEDPVTAGLVQSYARPGGNLTGVITPSNPALSAKRLELLAEAVPAIRKVGVLVETPSGPEWSELAEAARARGVDLLPLAVRDRSGLPGVLADGKAAGAQALLMTDQLPYQGGDFQEYLIIANTFARQQRIPLITNGWSPVQLLSYSDSLPEKYTIATAQVDRVLRGTKPADLPVEQVRTFDLTVNLALAQTLGLTIAPAVLARSTEITDPGAAHPRRGR